MVQSGSSQLATNRPIVILACPRSGTTLLSTMLHSHPRIAVAPETRYLVPTYLQRERFGDLTVRANREKLARWITRPGGGTKFNDLGIDRDATIARIVSGPPTVGSAFAAVWEEFAQSRGKQRWGEKRPSYYLWTDLILRLFPDTQFVHIVRDPRACVASLLATTWWSGGFERGLTAWVRAEWATRRLERTAPPNAYYRLRYEDLVTSPRRELTALCAYLGEEFDEQMLDHTKAAQDIVHERQVHHNRTHTQVDPTRIEAWRNDLDSDEIGLIEAVTRRAMRRHGYEVSGLGIRPSPRLALSFANVLARRVYSHRRTLLRDAVRRRRETRPIAAVPSPASRQPA